MQCYKIKVIVATKSSGKQVRVLCESYELTTDRYFDRGDWKDVHAGDVDMTSGLQTEHELYEAESGDIVTDDQEPEDTIVRFAVWSGQEVLGDVGQVEDHDGEIV